jgi:serine/threonine-protein kinase
MPEGSVGSGTRVGPYEVVELIGAGGMGEVYRATDTKLHRQVALKVLPGAVAADPERLVRFRREAQVLAALNHPNIAHIHGFEETSTPTGQDELHAIVMELVEGPTLADRIAQGPVPVDETIAVARQMAEALEAAHEQGIIHRDLKPANVKVRDDGVVKVLDFGLARAMQGDGSGPGEASPSNSPTLTARATQMGMILGTAAYMAPEQAKGRPVDKRADIWAFGVVIYEMLTGDRCFKGDDISETLASVIKEKPSFKALPKDTPRRLVRLLERCLERDPKERLRDIGEARVELAKLAASPADETAVPAPASALPSSPARSRVAWLVAAALAALLVGTLAVWAPWTAEPTPQPMRFSVLPPVELVPLSSVTDRSLAIAPDGRHLAFVTNNGGLVVRRIDELESRPLAGIDGARSPFFSPDGKWVGFFDADGLKKVSVTGGPAVAICSYTGGPRGASWSSDETIVFATGASDTGLFVVPSGGGEEPRLLTTPAAGEGNHILPSFLPDGRAVLYTISAPEVENSQIALLDLETGQSRILVRGGSQAEYVEPGYLVYGASGTLRGQRFDPASREVTSDAVPVLDRLRMAGFTGAAEYAVSRTGILTYMPGGISLGNERRSLVWVDRAAREEAIGYLPPRSYYSLRLSPDGTRVAVEIRDQEGDVWILDLAGEKLSRLTLEPTLDSFPVWTHDSRRVVFRRRGGASGDGGLFWQAADGTGTAERLSSSPTQQTATALTPDDGSLFFNEESGAGGRGFIGLLSMETLEATPFLQPSYEVKNAAVSPDGRFLAYESHETSTPQVFVQPIPNLDDGRWQVSTAGGVKPVWAPDGRELFYVHQPRTLASNSELYAVPVSTTPVFNPGKPVKLFDMFNPLGQTNGRSYDISPDGTRFIMVKDPSADGPESADESREIVFVLNWPEELKTRVGGR